MSTVEKKVVKVNIINIGSYTAELPRINAPLSIQALMKSLPLKGRALKQGSRLVLPTDLKVRPERPKSSFSKGDLSIDPSSGNLSIHLEDGSTRTDENYLGKIEDEFEPSGGTISYSVIIKDFND